MPGKRIPDHLQVWVDARKRFHLSHAQIQMAGELDLNPKKLGKLANEDQELWKVPLPQFLERLYRKRFRRDRPDQVMSIEEKVKKDYQKKLAKKARKRGDEHPGVEGIPLNRKEEE
jgi:hypothetical protein